MSMVAKSFQAGTIASFPATRIVRVFPGLRDKLGVTKSPNEWRITSQEHNVAVKFYRVTSQIPPGGTAAEYCVEFVNTSGSVLTNVAWQISKIYSSVDGSGLTGYAAEAVPSGALRSVADVNVGAYVPTIAGGGLGMAPTFVVGSLDAGDDLNDVSDPSFLHENGVTDGLANAIQAMFDAGDGAVYIRRGSYETTSATESPGGFAIPAGCTVEGEGLDTVIVGNYAAITGPLFTLGANSSLKNMSIDPVDAPSDPLAINVIAAYGDDCLVENVDLTQAVAIGQYVNMVEMTGNRAMLKNVQVSSATCRCLTTSDGIKQSITDCNFLVTGEAAFTEVVRIGASNSVISNLFASAAAATAAGALTQVLNITAAADLSTFTGVDLTSNVCRNLLLAAGFCVFNGLTADSVAIPTIGTELISITGNENVLEDVFANQNTEDGEFLYIMLVSGARNSITSLRLNSNDAPLLHISGSDNRVKSAELELGTPIAGTEAVLISGEYARIESCNTQITGVNTLTAIYRMTGAYGVFDLLYAWNALDVPAIALNGADNSVVSNSIFNTEAAEQVVLINECEHFRLHDCQITVGNALAVGIHILGADSAEVISRCKIDGNEISSLGGGIRLQGGTDAGGYLYHCIVENNYITYVTLGGIILNNGNASVQYSQIIGNKIFAAAAVDGVIIGTTCTYNTIARNDIDLSENDACSAVFLGAFSFVKNNTIRGGGATQIGVEVSTDVSYASILGNIIALVGISTGISLANNADLVKVSGNTIIIEAAGDATIGITSLGDSCVISDNIIQVGNHANSRGINLGAGTLKNAITGNNITLNTAGTGIHDNNVANNTTGVVMGNVITPGGATALSLGTGMTWETAANDQYNHVA